MTPGEFAFLALGLILGTATGAAMIVIARSQPSTHEIRLTVVRDAVPRRGSTLASDAFGEALPGPATGGPGDRRDVDRSDAQDGTAVRFEPRKEPAMASKPGARRKGRIAIRPERDGLLARLGVEAPARSAANAAVARFASPSADLIWRILDRDETAMLELLEATAAADTARREECERLLTAFVEAAADRAIDLAIVDVPLGNPFWDTFTIDQCREVIAALASMNRRFDGREGWVDGLAPGYRDMSQALADVGMDPRRIRAWPNQTEIAALFDGARPAAREAVQRFAPDLDPASLQAFLADRGADLGDLWLMWDRLGAGVGVVV